MGLVMFFFLGGIGAIIFLFQEEILDEITGNLLLTVITLLVKIEISLKEMRKKMKILFS